MSDPTPTPGAKPHRAAVRLPGPRVVWVERERGRWMRPERRRAQVVHHVVDRVILQVAGEPHLADFSRISGWGLRQPREGERTARRRPGRDWSGWRLRWADWSPWAVDGADLKGGP